MTRIRSTPPPAPSLADKLTTRSSVSVVGPTRDLFTAIERIKDPAAVTVTSWPNLVEIIPKRSKHGEIRHLTITDHGLPALQAIGDSHVAARQTGDGRWQVQVHEGTWRSFEAELSKLKPYFAPEAVVLLGGCRVGATERGREFLKRLSDVLDVTVMGYDADQDSVTKGADGDAMVCQPGHASIDDACLALSGTRPRSKDADHARSVAEHLSGSTLEATSWLEAGRLYHELKETSQATMSFARAIVAYVNSNPHSLDHTSSDSDGADGRIFTGPEPELPQAALAALLREKDPNTIHLLLVEFSKLDPAQASLLFSVLERHARHPTKAALAGEAMQQFLSRK